MEIEIAKCALVEQVMSSKLGEEQDDNDKHSNNPNLLLPSAHENKPRRVKNPDLAIKKILDRINVLMAEKDLVLVTKTKDELLDSTLIYFSLIKIRVNIIYKPVYKLNEGRVQLIGVNDWDQLRCFLGRLATLISKYPQNALESLKHKNLIICQHALSSKSEASHPEMHIFQLDQHENLEIHLYKFVLNSNGNNLSLCN